MKSNSKTISVIGLGYIGLPTAAMFASRKVKVIGVDINKHAVDTINQGKIHIVEPALDMIVHAAVTEGYLRATTQVESADVFLIAVPTPFKGEHEPDLAYVKAATESVAPLLKKGDVIILESTSPVGTTEKMVSWLSQYRKDLVFPSDGAEEADIYIAYCPERVLPGQIVRELVENDRIIGGMNAASSQKAKEVYRVFVEGELLVTNARTAEMAKLTENAYRDVNIAFANELSLICDKLDINVWELIKFANHHPRVNILQPGAGVGGHCIAVDPWFIVDKTPEEARLIHCAREVNDFKPEWVIRKFDQMLEQILDANSARERRDIKVAVLGLSFKPNIDDLRESPSLRIAEQLSEHYSCKLLLVEPNIEDTPDSLRRAELCSLAETLDEADIVLTLVGHAEFLENKEAIRKHPCVIDVCGVTV